MTAQINRKKGILLILASAFCFASMSAVSSIVGDVSAMQKMFFRSVLVAVVTAVVMKAKGQSFAVKKDCLKLHFLRSLFGMLGVIGNYYGMSHMVLSDANTIMEMSPFFVIVLSAIVLKEKADAKQYAFIIMALAGVAFVIKPSAALLSNPTSLLVLGASICAGFAYMYVRALGAKGESGPVIVFVFSVFSAVACLPSMIINPPQLTARQILLLLLMGAFACLGQFTVTAAYRCAPGSEISIFDYSQVLFSALYGWIFYKQLADKLSYIGYVIIISAALLMFLYNKKKARS